VLAPSGRLIAVIPNRAACGPHRCHAGCGPWQALFAGADYPIAAADLVTPTAWGEALFMPPVAGGWFLRSAVAWERVGAALSLPFAGVHIVEATKQVYRGDPGGHREPLAADSVAAAGPGAVIDAGMRQTSLPVVPANAGDP